VTKCGFDIFAAEVIPGSCSKMLLRNERGGAFVLDFNVANVFIVGRASGNASLEEVCRLIADHQCNVELLVEPDPPFTRVKVAGFAAKD
jgi:hypothetical protein